MTAWRHHLCRAGLWLVLALAAAAQAANNFNSVYISEVLAENRKGLMDEDEERSPWIELHNGGPGTVDLKGWFLATHPTNLTQWRFPGVALLPGKEMIVFASGKARTRDLSRLHTNFRLAAATNYLALVEPSGKVVSELACDQSSPDVSFGRLRGEPAICGHFVRPTPGKANASSGSGFAPEVVFSARGGSLTAPFTLQLATRSSNAMVRYTLDGTLPTRASPAYASPLQISNTVEVRARAYEEGLLPGPPRSEAYLFLHTNMLSFTSTLPVLVMETFGTYRPASPRSAYVSLALYEPKKGVTSLMNPSTMGARGGFHERGSSSRGMPQTSYMLELVDEFNHEQHRSLLGLPADSDWILHAPNGYEPGMINNPLVHQLSRDMGRYSPRTRFLEVFLVTHAGPVTANDYFGIYVLEEKIKVGKHRVNIDRLGPTDVTLPEVTGGYLLKIDRAGPGEAGFGAAGVSMVYVEPKEPVINLPQSAAQRRYLETYFEAFDRALNGLKWLDPSAGYRAFIDVDAWIDYHVLEVLSGNVDALTLSTYLHKPRNGKLVFGPHWDFDRAAGSTDDRDAEPRQWNTGQYFGAPWWNTLFTDPDFWQQWVDRWQELRLTHFSQAHVNSLIDILADQVREAQPRQVRRWGLQPRGGSYQTEINHMKNWLSNRVDFIDGQLVQPPRLSHAPDPNSTNFILTVSGATNSAFYYTLNGTDPRLSQGGISSNAVLYAGPVKVAPKAQVVARSRNPNRHQSGGPPSSTPWSRPVKMMLPAQP